MSETKFTKGDLYVVQVGDVNYIDTETGFTFAQAFCEHDAHLIAAAPEMYSEIDRDINWLTRMIGTHGDDYPMTVILKEMRTSKIKLLAKARGEKWKN